MTSGDNTTQDNTRQADTGQADPGQADTGRDTSVTPVPDKDPEDWVTGDEPMTGPQESYLNTLAHEAGVDVPPDLTKARASELIDELQTRTGRG